MTGTDRLTIINADALTALKTLPDNSVQCCVTSPPYYGLRNYGVEGQIGAEKTPEQYIASLVDVFREVRRVLREDGVLWLNLGDSYTSGGRKTRAPDAKDGKGGRENDTRPDTPHGLKAKDLLMIPARVALALQADGWYLRSVCPWIKRNAMPESVKDRPATTIETIFMLTKSAKYYYDAEAVKVEAAQPNRKRADRFGGNKHTGETTMHSDGSVFVGSSTRTRRSSDWFIESWQGLLQDEEGDPLAFVVNTRPYKGAHFATFPPHLVKPCIVASTKGRAQQSVVLDPFGGSGTTAAVALELGCNSILVELNADYIPLIRERCAAA
jgi:DNA modification methylase